MEIVGGEKFRSSFWDRLSREKNLGLAPVGLSTVFRIHQQDFMFEDDVFRSLSVYLSNKLKTVFPEFADLDGKFHVYRPLDLQELIQHVPLDKMIKLAKDRTAFSEDKFMEDFIEVMEEYDEYEDHYVMEMLEKFVGLLREESRDPEQFEFADESNAEFALIGANLSLRSFTEEPFTEDVINTYLECHSGMDCVIKDGGRQIILMGGQYDPLADMGLGATPSWMRSLTEKHFRDQDAPLSVFQQCQAELITEVADTDHAEYIQVPMVCAVSGPFTPTDAMKRANLRSEVLSHCDFALMRIVEETRPYIDQLLISYQTKFHPPAALITSLIQEMRPIWRNMRAQPGGWNAERVIYKCLLDSDLISFRAWSNGNHVFHVG